MGGWGFMVDGGEKIILHTKIYATSPPRHAVCGLQISFFNFRIKNPACIGYFCDFLSFLSKGAGWVDGEGGVWLGSGNRFNRF